MLNELLQFRKIMPLLLLHRFFSQTLPQIYLHLLLEERSNSYRVLPVHISFHIFHHSYVVMKDIFSLTFRSSFSISCFVFASFNLSSNNVTNSSRRPLRTRANSIVVSLKPNVSPTSRRFASKSS